MNLHATLAEVTERIVRRSAFSRQAYLARLDHARSQGAQRNVLSCTNLAHGYAAVPSNDKLRLRTAHIPSIAIVSSYNDMLSAHQPYAAYPDIIKRAAREAGAVAQFAGGTPAMCDGVTQGQPGMELSLFSRDAIAMATAVALSHNMFDAALYLGICDKIVPGLLIGALHFGHLPAIFVPGGPMSSGLGNKEKARVRQAYAQNKATREELLQSEEQSYHGAGTCTFYGTANSNQMLVEAMGLHLPGSAFVPPDTLLREHLTAETARQVLKIVDGTTLYRPIGHVINEKSIVNAVVALHATGGSTNHTLHLVAIAKAAGIVLDWTDFDRLSSVVPLLTRIYPNGEADVNHFRAAGGTGFVLRELIDAGLMHEDVPTILGDGLRTHCAEPGLADDADGRPGRITFCAAPAISADESVLRPAARPFSADGGLRLLSGNLGRAVIKVSAVAQSHWVVEAPARVFASQHAFLEAYQAGQLDTDFVAVLRFQGPASNGMPELHSLTPALANLQDAGRHVALITDGRMSGASGKVPSAIHITPEALHGGLLARVENGDMIRLDAVVGTLELLVDSPTLAARKAAVPDLSGSQAGCGRELFGLFRKAVSPSESGATTFDLPMSFDNQEHTV